MPSILLHCLGLRIFPNSLSFHHLLLYQQLPKGLPFVIETFSIPEVSSNQFWCIPGSRCYHLFVFNHFKSYFLWFVLYVFCFGLGVRINWKNYTLFQQLTFHLFNFLCQITNSLG